MVKLQEIVRYTLKVLTFIILLILFIYFFLKDQVISFAKSRTTNTSRMLENSPNIEFPTLTFCLLPSTPATKLSVAKNYGFQNDNEKFYKEIPNSTLHQRLDELTYQLNRDFEIRSYYEKDKMEIGLQNIKKRKQNQVFFWPEANQNLQPWYMLSTNSPIQCWSCPLEDQITYYTDRKQHTGARINFLFR